ncbi:Protoporphyrinogen oxidase [Archaeoglobus sulfaticallidus PM70-1]|uniref:Protoporphyrinogen oxidase n=1 Tax=Archaeoglobus sulfaticallidus PM70-1 TaxID=387631 RepID=N0BJU6_9EURY|nr:NAD(P)/FAD-dependent oxidoreductase [Archaeoglobus sulfaticallidus]AGK60410.1 Protoporphyrinogen oxidase [Archaeoglobus sulfaticallidus PM70-1]
MRVAVIGAGLTGLTCARLLGEYADVKVFESESAGGLLSSYYNSERGYWIEKFYHHCFRNDEHLIELIRDLRLSGKLVWRIARTGVAVDGRIYPLNTPFEILRYPYMRLMDKVRLARFTLRAKKRNFIDFDDVGVVEGIRDELGDELLNDFFLPLLKSKFGENYERVSYAWLLARVSIRSNRRYSGEELGYLKGGFQQLVERLAEGVDIAFSKAAIAKAGEKFAVMGERFDAVVYTAPLPALDRELRRAAGLPETKYQSSVCALIGAEEGITEDIYWINLKNPSIFGAIIEHTNFMDFEDYGEHVIYLASYSTPEGQLFNTSNDKLEKLYMKELERFGIGSESINWIRVFKARFSGPIYEKGYLRKITDYRTRVKGFYVAGMTSRHNYPERSMNGSIRSGIEVAKVVMEDFGLV